MDTVGTKIIVRPDVVNRKSLLTTAWRLRMTTGAAVNVHKKVDGLALMSTRLKIES